MTFLRKDPSPALLCSAPASISCGIAWHVVVGGSGDQRTRPRAQPRRCPGRAKGPGHGCGWGRTGRRPARRGAPNHVAEGGVKSDQGAPNNGTGMVAMDGARQERCCQGDQSGKLTGVVSAPILWLLSSALVRLPTQIFSYAAAPHRTSRWHGRSAGSSGKSSSGDVDRDLTWARKTDGDDLDHSARVRLIPSACVQPRYVLTF
jgi:hypothetical protein